MLVLGVPGDPVSSPSYLRSTRNFSPKDDSTNRRFFMVNVGKYTSPMDHLGMNTVDGSEILKTAERNSRYCIILGFV